MPELPEVQTVVWDLKQEILNKKIVQIKVFDKKLLKQELIDFFSNKTIAEIERKGKYILFSFKEGGGFILHLRMTGQFLVVDANYNDFKKSDRAVFYFKDKCLIFRDVRRFGTLCVFENQPDLSKIGVDPLSDEFTLEVFKKLLSSSTCGIKAFLLKQDKIAGLGNIYADEALFEAKINPKTSTQSLCDQDIKRLKQAIVSVLKLGLERKGTRLGEGLGNFRSINGEGTHYQVLQVYGKKSGKCPTCHGQLIKEVIASRGTTYCPHCQPFKYT
jgi:formamidopyrimidine-DNA glycosylase